MGLELLYVPEHLKCVNYDSDRSPIVEIVETEGSLERDLLDTYILYVLNGKVKTTHGAIQNYELSKGDFMLLPPGVRLVVQAETPARIMTLRINDSVVICGKYSLEDLYRDLDVTRLRQTHLKSNSMVRGHIEMLAENVTNGLRCIHFLDMKVRETFYYLRAYYRKKELAAFCLPLLSPDSRFMDLVWRNYRQAHNAKQFAEMTGYSTAAFRVRFKKITGIPVAQWLAQQKAMNVYSDICGGQKSLKEISEEYHFASASHLGVFCHKNFGVSPGKLKPTTKGLD